MPKGRCNCFFSCDQPPGVTARCKTVAGRTEFMIGLTKDIAAATAANLFSASSEKFVDTARAGVIQVVDGNRADTHSPR